MSTNRISKEGIAKYIEELKENPEYKPLLKDLKKITASVYSQIEMQSSNQKDIFYNIGVIKPYDNEAQVELAVRFKESKDSKDLEPEVVILKRLWEDTGIVMGTERIRELHPNSNIYAPQIYSPTGEGWLGFDTAYAIVYPFIPGKTLGKHILELKTDATLFEKLVDYAQQMSTIAAKIEEYNLKNGNHDPWWNYSGFRGIWDFKPDNFLVQDEKIIFFDFQPMQVNPYDCFLGLFNDFLGFKVPKSHDEKEMTAAKLLENACFADIPSECKKQFAEILQTDYQKTSFKELSEKLTSLKELSLKLKQAKTASVATGGIFSAGESDRVKTTEHKNTVSESETPKQENKGLK